MASEGLVVADSNFCWVSLFLILQMKTSLIHSASSDSLMTHVLARSVSVPQNCSKESQSLCFRFKSLYLLKCNVWRFVKNKVQDVPKVFKTDRKTFTLKFFLENTLCPSFPRARNKMDPNFLSASALLNPEISFVIYYLLLSGFVRLHCISYSCLSTGFFRLRIASCELFEDWNLVFW